MPATLPYAVNKGGREPSDSSQPLGQGPTPSLPWVPADAPLADYMLAAFVASVGLLHETVPGDLLVQCTLVVETWYLVLTSLTRGARVDRTFHSLHKPCGGKR